MRYVPEVEEEIRREIRDARAADPLITVHQVKEICEAKFHRPFAWRYIKRLCQKVYRQGLVDVDRMRLEERLHITREKFRLASERLLHIILWEPSEDNPTARPPSNRDVIEATKNFAMLELALVQAEISNGLYKRPVDAIAREVRLEPLPDDIRAVIIASWKRGGLLPEATIHEMVPAQTNV